MIDMQGGRLRKNYAKGTIGRSVNYESWATFRISKQLTKGKGRRGIDGLPYEIVGHCLIRTQVTLSDFTYEQTINQYCSAVPDLPP